MLRICGRLVIWRSLLEMVEREEDEEEEDELDEEKVDEKDE